MASTNCPECSLRMTQTREHQDGTGRYVGFFVCKRCGHSFEDYVDKYDGKALAEQDEE